MLVKIEYAGANDGSFEQASMSLEVLGEISIGGKHVQRLTERLGRERCGRRDAEVEAFKAGKLKRAYAEPPEVAAVHLDAGKLQLRQEGGGPGVRQPRWGDSKVGCFITYAGISGDSDPQVDPPAAFLDPPHVMRLCREMERVRSQVGNVGSKAVEKAGGELPGGEGPKGEHPVRLVRTAVATTESVEPFGWMVAAEAMKRGFYGAKRRAVVGDGGNWIGPLGDMHFPGWVQILDFLHLLVHLYAAAMAAYPGEGKKAWALYRRWLCWAWGGQGRKVTAGLKGHRERLGAPPAQAGDGDPRRIVQLTLEYVKANAGRMDYASYRRAGLPITSAPVESLIKQFNQRVKGTEKFWLSGGAEAILQARAAYLSEDGRAESFHEHRPRGHAVGKNRLKVPA